MVPVIDTWLWLLSRTFSYFVWQYPLVAIFWNRKQAQNLLKLIKQGSSQHGGLPLQRQQTLDPNKPKYSYPYYPGGAVGAGNDQNYMSSMAGSPMTESFFKRSDMYSVDLNNEMYDVDGNHIYPPQFGKRSNATA